MIFKQPLRPGISLSAIGLGGHEYLGDGSSRGFNEDFKSAVKPGYRAEGYGGEARQQLLGRALEAGINFFDVTIDPEKEALGRNLRKAVMPAPFHVQTRPEGMGYGYDPGNRKMAEPALLRAEVVRILELMHCEWIDFLNIPIRQSALDGDPEYMEKIRENVAGLKRDGFVRFATAENFSGEATYMEQIDAGCFDALVMNFSFADDAAREDVLPRAHKAGMAVFARELFLKGVLFRMGEEAGLTDRSQLARLSLKWNLGVPEVTSSIIGVRDTGELENCLSVLADPVLTIEEGDRLEQLRQTSVYREYAESRRAKFLG